MLLVVAIPSVKARMGVRPFMEQGAVEAFKDAGWAILSFVFEGYVATPSNPLPRGPATANRARRLLRSAPGSVGGLCKAIAAKEHIANR